MHNNFIILFIARWLFIFACEFRIDELLIRPFTEHVNIYLTQFYFRPNVFILWNYAVLNFSIFILMNLIIIKITSQLQCELIWTVSAKLKLKINPWTLARNGVIGEKEILAATMCCSTIFPIKYKFENWKNFWPQFIATNTIDNSKNEYRINKFNWRKSNKHNPQIYHPHY